MILKKKITLLVPCKNEEHIIEAFIKKVPSYVDEIIVVDNNSKDHSVSAAQKAGAVVYRERRAVNGIGYGYAHQKGMEKATGDIIVAMDSDDTYPVRAIKRIVTYMEKHHLDFISCNRLPLTNPRAISSIRRFGIMLLNMQIRILFRYPIMDALSGMWVMKKSSIREIMPKSGDWNFSPEIKLNAITNKNVHFAERHIAHFERMQEPSKQQIFRTGVMHALFITNLWLGIKVNQGKAFIESLRLFSIATK